MVELVGCGRMRGTGVWCEPGLLLVRGEQAGAGGGERWGRGAKERAVR